MRGDRLARWRWTGWLLGALLLVSAAAVLAATVAVRTGRVTVSCGSAWDVIAGRSGWQQWWAMDQADPVAGAARPRTDGCVEPVNAHLVWAALLAAGALSAFIAAAALGRRGPTTSPGANLSRFGTAVTLLGVVLCVGGVSGIAILVADPDASLFLYVQRPVVALLGLMLVLPSVLLVVLGRGASILAGHLYDGGARDESP